MTEEFDKAGSSAADKSNQEQYCFFFTTYIQEEDEADSVSRKDIDDKWTYRGPGISSTVLFVVAVTIAVCISLVVAMDGRLLGLPVLDPLIVGQFSMLVQDEPRFGSTIKAPRILISNKRKGKHRAEEIPDSIFTHEKNWDSDIKCAQNNSVFKHSDRGQQIPVFWINMDTAHRRRKLFEKQLDRLGLKNQRISAVSPSSGIKYKREVRPIIQETPTELACLSSHLLAIYAAVHDNHLNPRFPYALIIEDDVVFEQDVNFTALAINAPADFGILQLMTSNAHHVWKNWDIYKSAAKAASADTVAKKSLGHGLPWKDWQQSEGLWSTQAYLINKKNVLSFVDRAVQLSGEVDPKMFSSNQSHPHINLKIGSPNEKLFPCKGKGASKECMFPFRIVADYFLYYGGAPTYFARIPVFNGAKVKSSIHAHHGKSHAQSFDLIAKVIEDARNHSHLLPPYIRPFKKCNSSRSAEFATIQHV